MLKSFHFETSTEFLQSLLPAFKYDMLLMTIGFSAVISGIEIFTGLNIYGVLGLGLAFIVELISGIMASRKRNEPFQSSKLSRFTLKAACYMLVIGISHLMYLSYEEKNTLAASVFEWLNTFFIVEVVTELLFSILENMAVLTGRNKDHWITKIKAKVAEILK